MAGSWFSLLSLAVCVALTVGAPQVQNADTGKVVYCYWGSWSTYRWGAGKLEANMIDPNTCTHLVYAFAGLDDRTYEIKSLDAWNDLPNTYPGGGKDNYRNLIALKYKNPNLKVLLAVGGWNEGGAKYSVMASRPERRQTFVTSVVNHLTTFGFDGIDLDWEWPTAGDRDNYVSLLQELRTQLNKHNLMLTAAVPANLDSIDKGFNLPEVMKQLDFLAIMAYDYVIAYSGRLDHPTPLKGKLPTQQTVAATVEHVLSKVPDPSKILLGLTTYGRSWTLLTPTKTNIGDQSSGPGEAGPFTQEKGLLAWFELCEKFDLNKLTVKRDNDYQAPYAYSDREWYGYDDLTSLEVKVKYAQEKKLGGVMIWSLENDDNNGVCGKTLASSIKGFLY